MNLLNKKAACLKQGKIRAMFDKASNYGDVISLGIGEPDFVTPRAICEAGKRAIDQGKTHYTANAGIFELRKKITEMEEIRRLKYAPEREVIITPGGMGALSLCLQVILDAGDQVLIQDPQWLNYESQVYWAGGVSVKVPARPETGFQMEADTIEKLITPRTKVLMINSPNNPTGGILEEETAEELAVLAVRHDLIVISDEVYDTLVYDGIRAKTIAALPGMKERTIVINSFSKAFAMTGWRVGYALGPAEVIGKMVVLQENFNSCVSAPGQYAALYALDHPEYAEEMRREYEARRNIVVEGLSQIPGLSCAMPRGAFYIFLDIRGTGLSSEEFCDRLLESKQVVCIPGSAFGRCGEGFVRISYASDREKLITAVRRIREFTEGLKK